MKRAIVAQLPTPNHPVRLERDEAEHLRKVLRMGLGDTVIAVDGQGGAALARLDLADGGRPALHYISSIEHHHGAETVPIRLELSVLKGDAMSWAIEKAVELGVETLHPVWAERSVPRPKAGDASAFVDRWRRVADQALKQCGRTRRMEILPPLALAQLLVPDAAASGPRAWLDEGLAAETGTAPSLLALCQRWFAPGAVPPPVARLLIGPEGGWSDAERDAIARSEATPCGLGPLILRAETAAIAAVGLVAPWFRARLDNPPAAK